MKGVVKGSAIDGVKSAIAADALAEDVLAVKGTALRAKAGPKWSGSVFCRVGAAVDRNGDGASNGEWHLDNVHLLPSATTAAFARHCHLG